MFSITSGPQNGGGAAPAAPAGNSQLRPNLRPIGQGPRAAGSGRAPPKPLVTPSSSSSSNNVVPRPSTSQSRSTPAPNDAFEAGEIPEDSHTPEDDDNNHFVNTNKKGKRVVRPGSQSTTTATGSSASGSTSLTEAQKKFKRFP
ncbi:hypothetical protein PtB15_14B312 [Puccinia triticina]|nr:hypothetical protein PtB15_14B312 [Puccinia triticina]